MISKRNILLFPIAVIFMLVFKFQNYSNINGSNKMNDNDKLEKATFGSGCFWCTEAIFEQLKGVQTVISGYTGGSKTNPTYKDICLGNTGHAEVTRILFLPEEISFLELLEVFWKTHDPTTKDRQGNDVGSQYRSVIYYHNEEQKKMAMDYKSKLDEAKIFDNPIVTEISESSKFYPAENYHQNYYEENKNEPYCNFVITPKVEKFKKVFNNKLK